MRITENLNQKERNSDYSEDLFCWLVFDFHIPMANNNEIRIKHKILNNRVFVEQNGNYWLKVNGLGECRDWLVFRSHSKWQNSSSLFVFYLIISEITCTDSHRRCNAFAANTSRSIRWVGSRCWTRFFTRYWCLCHRSVWTIGGCVLTDSVMVFPILVLTEGTAITRDITTTARLTCFSTAIPTILNNSIISLF